MSQAGEFLLRADNIGLAIFKCFGVTRLVSQQLVDPLKIDFVARETSQEIGPRHAYIANAQLHDGAFLGANLILRATDALNQRLVLLGYQFDRHEQQGQLM